MGVTSFNRQASQFRPTTSHLSELLKPIAGPLATVEARLRDQVRGFAPGIGDHVEYVLGVAGKRLRPTLALLAGGATGRIDDPQITLGVIVELIHVATLVHDDILDDATLRHGLPTANSQWGNDLSVLLGDCLFAHALSLAASYPTTTVCRKISLATNTVCAGEILQTKLRYDAGLSIEKYLEIIDMKTGALFAVSCELGAELNAAPPPLVKALRDFGSNLGIAYQIYDDCVDIFGQEQKAGKSLGTDMKNGKLTLPWLLLLEHTGAAQRAGVAELIFRGNRDDRARLLALVTGNGVLAESRAMVEKYVARAETNLADLPANSYSQTLAALLDYITGKTRRLLNQEVAA